MHHPIIDHDIGTKGMADALVAEANAKGRDAAREITNDIVGQSRFAGRAGAGGNQDSFGLELLNLIERELVVAVDLHVHPHLAEILNEIIGK